MRKGPQGISSVKCIPYRGAKRPWRLSDLTRIVKHVCEKDGPEATYAAFRKGWCGKETECEKIVNRVLSAIAGAAMAWAVIGILDEVIELRWIAMFLKRTAWGKALTAIMAALRISAPNIAQKQLDLEILETQLRTWLRTGGKVWLEPPG